MKDGRHFFGDRCRAALGQFLARARFVGQFYVYPPDDRFVLSFQRHRCGPWCTPVDTGGPVLQGRRGEKVGRELGLSVGVVEMLARLRQKASSG